MSLIYSTTKQFKIVAFFLLSFLCSEYIMAQVYVQGYHRKDGTYVKSHYRSSPDSSPYNNYSYPGNTNPYTGKVATGNTDTYLKNYSNSSSTYSNYSNNSYPTNIYNNTISYPSHDTSTFSTGANSTSTYNSITYPSYNTNTYSKKTERSIYSTKNPHNSIFN